MAEIEWTPRRYEPSDAIMPPPYDVEPELRRWHLVERLIAAAVIVGLSIGAVALWG